MNNDLISREALIDDFRNDAHIVYFAAFQGTEPCPDLSIYDVIDRIREFPAEDAKIIQHGYWIGIEYDGYADGIPVYSLYECSNCGYERKGEETPDFCEYCGCQMDARSS